MRIKVGIFFGGPSREREVSFAGGRTVYDNLNKTIFEAVPIFIDAASRPVLIDWQYIYKGSIRDFYPPVSALPASARGFQVYEESLGLSETGTAPDLRQHIGTSLRWEDLPSLIDIAFLALHGISGEDGRIQGLLEMLHIPYTGSGIFASAFGMDKALQKQMMRAAGFATPAFTLIHRSEWEKADPTEVHRELIEKLGPHFVSRPARQGSSIGVHILQQDHSTEQFIRAVESGFFIEKIKTADWCALSPEEKYEKMRSITDIREGIGFPLLANGKMLSHPEQLFDFLENSGQSLVTLEALQAEQTVLLESFIRGKEFSCIVIRDAQLGVVALPPTEIIKQAELFDYRSKYLPGLSRKKTPIDLAVAQIEAIQRECERLFETFHFECYARIDGFFADDGQIFLNDPNTTSGMMPSSFFFHQAAEIGLDPSAFLSFIIHSSLEERLTHSMPGQPTRGLLEQLQKELRTLKSAATDKKAVAVILGGYSFERHISVESGRNIYEKLASSDKYLPIPLFLKKDGDTHRLFQLPISLLLKDNADDIADKLAHFSTHPITEKIRVKTHSVTERFSPSHAVLEPVEWSFEELGKRVDAVFIALHGRPGEDGTLQSILDEYRIPYNGSSPESSAITINKYETLQTLKQHGFPVADQLLVDKHAFHENPESCMALLEGRLNYPFVGKPVDDGCSSAVVMIRDRGVLRHYLEAIFRDPSSALTTAQRQALRLHPNDEFPAKDSLLFESKISREDAQVFMEITTGLMTYLENGDLKYLVFDPSESLAGSEILSLEEKFLAGEGQNITPARLGRTAEEYQIITTKIKADLERAAKILRVTGYARIDAFVRVFDDLRVETVIIEVNSLPGMTPATCIFHQAALQALKPAEFIDRIIDFGITTKQANEV